MSLGALLDNSVAHERIPVAVDRRLTTGAWAGLALLVVQLLVLHIGRSATDGFATWGIVSWAFTGFGHPEGAYTLTQGVIVAGLVGAVVTRGFTRAATVGHSGQLGLLAAGVASAVPTAWILTVLVAIVVAAVVLVAIGATVTVLMVGLGIAVAPAVWRFCVAVTPVLWRTAVAVLPVLWRLTVAVLPAVQLLLWIPKLLVRILRLPFR